MSYIIGILLALVGTAMILKTQWLYENLGTVDWAEEHLGTAGGTRLFYKLVGLIVIFVGFLLITGLWEGFLFATIGKIFLPK